MKIIEGDLIKLALEGEFDVIVHGCNCFCAMGAGIAKQIKAVFPEAYKVDLETREGGKEKLGNYTSVRVQRNGREFVIINAYTQYHWRGKGLKADYDAIAEVMRRIKNNYPGLRIGYPLLGAGLAGGDWEIISKIINKELVDENHCLVKLKF